MFATISIITAGTSMSKLMFDFGSRSSCSRLKHYVLLFCWCLCGVHDLGLRILSHKRTGEHIAIIIIWGQKL